MEVITGKAMYLESDHPFCFTVIAMLIICIFSIIGVTLALNMVKMITNTLQYNKSVEQVCCDGVFLRQRMTSEVKVPYDLL